MTIYIKIDNDSDEEKNVTVSFASEHILESTKMTRAELIDHLTKGSTNE